MKNILLLCGGGGSEHEISLLSAKYIFDTLATCDDYKVFKVEILRNGDRIDQDGYLCELRKAGEIFYPHSEEIHKLDFAIPCIHGPPGENGIIQSIFELMGLPYLGVGPEASQICFNKVSTKLWLDALQIPNTEYIFLGEFNEVNKHRAQVFFDQHKDIYIKAASQGSSVGCYHVNKEEYLEKSLTEAFKFSDFVLIEKTQKARELEISVYEYEGQIHASLPGEIICPDGFYTFEQKYSKESKTHTDIVAKNIPQKISDEMKDMAIKAFRGLKLKHLSRVDFFLTDDGKVFINEINTFPGMTPISMFPKMMENNGHKFKTYLNNIIQSST
ncbi:D-alanine--D-alanine ligase [Halobacteriovorax sp. HLS]|uniref:D-alanine--D-alanine ligase n=1 Tax=Halobacteriovorax sp. HLS TaxID=2234000 RepID=UPI0019D4436D|nr:D-alanine--D-alanine ligase [Halobacteriovorax sp. HLS]